MVPLICLNPAESCQRVLKHLSTLKSVFKYRGQLFRLVVRFCHFMDLSFKRLKINRFGKKLFGTGIDRFSIVFIIAVSRYHTYLNLGKYRFHLLKQFQTRHSGHIDIRENIKYVRRLSVFQKLKCLSSRKGELKFNNPASNLFSEFLAE